MKRILILFVFFFIQSISFCSLDKIQKLIHKSNSLVKQNKSRKALSILEKSLKKNEVNFAHHKFVIRLRNQIARIYLLSDNDHPAIELLKVNMKFLLSQPQNVDPELWNYFQTIGDRFYQKKYIKSAQLVYQWIFQVMTKIKQEQIRFVSSYDENILSWSRLAVARSHVDMGNFAQAWQIISIMNQTSDPLYQYVKGRILFSWSLKLNKKEAYKLLQKAAFNGVGEAIYFLAYQFSNQMKKNAGATFYWYKILSYFIQDSNRLHRFGLDCFNDEGLLKEVRKNLDRAETHLSSKFLKTAYRKSKLSFQKIVIQIKANNLKYVDSSDTEVPKSAKQLIECFERQKVLNGALVMYSLDKGEKIIVNSYVDQIKLSDKGYIKKFMQDNNKDRYRSDQKANLWC
ncbi:hypothetical protein MJH12_11675, partial [bacterium]|nr:hypothetical protein [bacterium]